MAEEVARAGAINSLSQTLLKLTAPGVPDIYQGNEIWDFSLVDPDNRRAVDYARRKSLLSSLVAVNANLQMLEYMWGPSDFTVTGPLKSFDRTSDLSSLTVPVLFQCGEFDEARPDTVREQAALTPNAVYHVIEMAALVLLYVAARGLTSTSARC